MMADELLNAQDLITAKKHDTFHSEVITGKTGGLSTGADIDYATNAVTGQAQTTLPKLLSNVGFSPAGFDFTTGGTLTERNKSVYYQTDGNWYHWAGTLPKTIPAASTPASTGGISSAAWVLSTSALMYRDFQGFTDALLAEAGIIDDGQPDTVGDSQRVDAMKIIAAKLLQYVGGGGAIGASIRDTFLVSRNLSTLTDCHAFADKTVISNATDTGTYGTFDSTTEIAGTHTQSHQFSFQNRAKFSGEGAITTWGGYISWPVLTGVVSTVNELFHFEARDLDSQGRFDAVTNQFGIKVYNQTKGMAGNYAYWTTQNWNGSTGYSFYSSGTGKMLQAGEAIFSSPVIFGASVPVAGVPISWTGGVGKQKGFVNSSATGIQYGVVGDYSHAWVSNSAERLILEGSAENYALRPASSTQNLGTDSRGFNIAKLKQVKFTPITAATADNLALFIDSTDGNLKYKSSTGVVRTLSFT